MPASEDLPGGVTAIASLFFLTGGYLSILALLMLVRPGSVSMSLGAPLLGGLELAGPYMFLLVAAAGASVGFGLLRRNNWARRVAIAIALLGVVQLVPTVSSAVIGFQPGALAWGGLGVIVRVMAVWYLFQEPVRDAFQKLPPQA